MSATASSSTAPTGSARRTPARATAATRKRRAHTGGAVARRAAAHAAWKRLARVRVILGVTIPETAEKMAIKQSYLYRVLPGLAKDGLVVKDGRGWKPTDVA